MSDKSSVEIGHFRILQDGHQVGNVGDPIEYPYYLGLEYVKLGILAISNELGDPISHEDHAAAVFSGQWPQVEGE
jgi:hypothetical protein